MKKIGIIGGGPAGLTAAITAADSDMEVVLWEKNKVDEQINCAEGYIDLTGLAGPPEAGIKSNVEKLEIEMYNSHLICTENINLWMIDRREWQRKLAENAVEKGVKINENHYIKKEDLDKLKKKYDWLIDASGIPSVSSIYCNFKNIYQKNALIGVQYRLKGDFSDYIKKIKTVALNEKPGYGYIFSKNKESVNVGIGIYNQSQTKVSGDELYQRLDNFIAEQKLKGEIVDKTGGICPNVSPESTVYDNIILTGDAAGLTSPLHGGGIDSARISARTAVKVIKEDNVEKYQYLLNNLLGKRIKVEKGLRDLWLKKGTKYVDKLLKIIVDKFNKNEIENLFNNEIVLKEIRLASGILKYL